MEKVHQNALLHHLGEVLKLAEVPVKFFGDHGKGVEILCAVARALQSSLRDGVDPKELVSHVLKPYVETVVPAEEVAKQISIVGEHARKQIDNLFDYVKGAVSGAVMDVKDASIESIDLAVQKVTVAPSVKVVQPETSVNNG